MHTVNFDCFFSKENSKLTIHSKPDGKQSKLTVCIDYKRFSNSLELGYPMSLFIVKTAPPCQSRELQGHALSGLSSLGVQGVPWHTQILADQLTLFQPGGQIMPT